jgi:hypothetical protein
MSALRKSQVEDLHSCFDFKEFLELLEKKIESWDKLADTFDKVRNSRASMTLTDNDTQVFARFLSYVKDLFQNVRSSSSAKSVNSWQLLLLYADVLESLGGLITQSWLMETLDKLDSKGALNKRQVLDEAAAVAKMSDYDYSLHILRESAVLIGEIQGDDVAFGYPPDQKLEDHKVRLQTLLADIEKKGSADQVTKRSVDDAVSEAMEYSIKRMTNSTADISKLLPSIGGSKTGTGGLN